MNNLKLFEIYELFLEKVQEFLQECSKIQLQTQEELLFVNEIFSGIYLILNAIDYHYWPEFENSVAEQLESEIEMISSIMEYFDENYRNN